MTISIFPREGRLYQDGYTEDGEPFIKVGDPYFVVVVDERLGSCDYELDTFETLTEAEEFVRDNPSPGSRFCGGPFCRCREFGFE